MICKSCGNEIKDGILFCPMCGARQAAAVNTSSGTASFAGQTAGNAGSVVLYQNKLVSNASNPLTIPTGRLTVTDSYVEFKSYLIGGNFKVTFPELSAAERTTYAFINKNSLELRLKNGKKYILTGFRKDDLNRLLEILNSRI